ncbi:MAG: transcriptional repressor [Alphaproteobacteria bacterium]|nr:MAG: transcriptional repressor [Alphaproteobacteria bacterium]
MKAQSSIRSEDTVESLTKNQRLVYDALLDAGRALGAYDLLDRLRPRGFAVAPSVYRALNELSGKGLVRHLTSVRGFVALHAGTAPTASAFMVCTRCGTVDQIVAEGLQMALEDGLVAAGFSPTEMVPEIPGTCRHCRTTEDAGAPSVSSAR